MSDVKLVRDRLEQIVVEIENGYPYDDAVELREMIELLKREKPAFKAKATHKKVTAEVAAEIRRVKAVNPKWSQVRIGRACNVNPGRVSEVLRGKRP